MLKTLLYVNEDLASSIALRFMAYLNKFIPLSLYVTHVEEPDEEQVGTGWVRRTWEEGVTASGQRLVERMLRTENIDCPLAGRPKIFVGDRDKEMIYELRNGSYDLYAEGYLNVSETEQFHELISSPLYTEAPCPVLLVKNLSISKKCALLCSDSVDPAVLVDRTMQVLADSSFEFDLVFFKFSENDELALLAESEGGANLAEVRKRLQEAGKSVDSVQVVAGVPEQVGDYLKNYALVSSTLPARKSMRMDVLAHSLASVLLVR